MENQLIELYLLACHVYDTRSETCFQRLSNNHRPDFTDQELIAIYLFGHFNGMFEKKAIHQFIDKYGRHFFPRLPSYQTFVARLNLLEQSFQTIGGYLNELLAESRTPEIDHIIDSVPVMLARGGHAYTARVARDVSDVGYCASKRCTSMEFACTLSRSAASGSCRCPHRPGSEKAVVMIYRASESKPSRCLARR